ncbi:MAG: enoyl-CoA hydratase [Ilumatobacteraceae bacterium]|nr:enoyl-CoA hydratase [Ilumatobacteraceae bacterium]
MPVTITRPRAGIVQITLDRQDRLNAMNSELVQGLHDAFRSIAVDREARVVVLTGAGRGFCAGLDLGGYGEAPHTEGLGRVQAGLAVQRHIAGLIPLMRSLPQPIIAAVNGAAAGGGLALVLGSDVRIASRSAKFNAAFIRIGLSACDIGTSWILPRIVGAARAQELMLTGRIFDVEEAYRIGLVVEVHDDDALIDAAYAKADQIMANAPMGVAMTKEGMWTALEVPMTAAIDIENRQQIMLSQTRDHREALAAFVERRPPVFTNS